MIHFKRKEFECRCRCGFDIVDYELVEVLEALRDHLDMPVIITSGNRCNKHNSRIGGSINSFHLHGQAADILVRGAKTSEVYEYLTTKYPDKYGIGVYDSWVHIDVRPNKARWDKRS